MICLQIQVCMVPHSLQNLAEEMYGPAGWFMENPKWSTWGWIHEPAILDIGTIGFVLPSGKLT
jgi:hypothetical protein